MAFIELTRPSGKKTFVNTKHIAFFEIGEDEDKFFTRIVTTSEGSIWVREQIEQVIEKIKEAK